MRTLLSILLVVSLGYGQGKPSPRQGPPPRNLTQKADGHFTANQDPMNPEKFEVYVVRTGDTLSMIAGSVMRNPRLWPQLWEQNDHIVNPHWIYPNDKILVKPVTLITEATPPPPPDPVPDPVAPPRRMIPPSGTTSSQPVPREDPKPAYIFDLGKSASAPEIKVTDLYCSGFVRKVAVPTDLKVAAKHNSDTSALATQGDYIYINQGTEDGVKLGGMYQVVRPTRKVDAPKSATRSDRNLGMHYLDIAQILVVMAQTDFAMARVVNTCDSIELGDVMLPFQKLDVPILPHPRPFSPFMKATGGLQGSIVMTRNVLLNFGSAFRASGVIPGTKASALASLTNGIATDGEFVYVDLGQASGVKPGDIFIVYRAVEMNRQLYNLPSESKSLVNQRTAVGELVILKVNESAATALVTYSLTGLSSGDFVERR